MDNGFTKGYFNVKDREKELMRCFNKLEEITHLYSSREMTYLSGKIILEKEVYFWEWDKIILWLAQRQFIIQSAFFSNKIWEMTGKGIKITPKLKSHGDKNIKHSGYRVKINIILKFLLIV